jgi:hypothetical protein
MFFCHTYIHTHTTSKQFSHRGLQINYFHLFIICSNILYLMGKYLNPIQELLLLQTDSPVTTDNHVSLHCMPNIYTSKPDKKLRQKTLLFQSQKVTASNLCLQTGYSDIFHTFQQPLQTKSEIVPQKIWSQLLLSTYFPIQHSCLLMLLQSKLLTDSLDKSQLNTISLLRDMMQCSLGHRYTIQLPQFMQHKCLTVVLLKKASGIQCCVVQQVCPNILKALQPFKMLRPTCQPT